MDNPFVHSFQPTGCDAALWCAETAEIVIQSPTESAIANFCIDTRIAFASFFEHRIELGVVPRVACEDVSNTIEKVLNSGVTDKFSEGSRPRTYLKSISFRNSLIKLLIEKTFEDVVRELAKNCGAAFSLGAAADHVADLTAESSNAVALATASLGVVRTTALLLLSELKNEVGPFARATNDHTRIAKYALLRGTLMSNAASDLAAYHDINDEVVHDSIQASRESLGELRGSIYEPLDEIANRLKPDDDSLEEAAKQEFAGVRCALPKLTSDFSIRYLRYLQCLPANRANLILGSSLAAVANQNEESLSFVQNARPFMEAT